MALIVETGAVIAGAESYCTVAEATTRHSNFGNTAWAALTTPQMEQALRKATAYMVQAYQMRWKGYRNSATQVLCWPRSFVYKMPYINGAVGSYPYLVADNIVPTEVKDACADLALKSVTETLMTDTTQQVTREKVGQIEVEYSEFSSQQKRHTAIDAMLAIYLTGSSVSVQLVR